MNKFNLVENIPRLDGAEAQAVEQAALHALVAWCNAVSPQGVQPANAVFLMLKACIHGLYEIDDRETGNMLRLLSSGYQTKTDEHKSNVSDERIADCLRRLMLLEIQKFMPKSEKPS